MCAFGLRRQTQNKRLNIGDGGFAAAERKTLAGEQTSADADTQRQCIPTRKKPPGLLRAA